MSLSVPAKSRIMLDTFMGLNKRERISSGELADCLNVTADKYPCLATRAPRALVSFRDEDKNIVSPMCPGKPTAALVDGDDIVIACENGAFIKGNKTYIPFNGKAKQIIAFNDRYVTAPLLASIDNELSFAEAAQAYLAGKMTVTLHSEADGDAIDYVSSEEAPTDGTKYWYSTKENGLYCWSESENKYVSWPTTYIRFASAELDFSDFAAGDAISVRTGSSSEEFSVTSYNIAEAQDGYIVVSGICQPTEDEECTIFRKAPPLDYIVSHKNRVWGCYYGSVTDLEGAKFVNEIYASKLGDEKNWYSYQGISTDSYTASVGEGGAFTGCGVVGDNVVFFKENCMYTIYGTQPSSYQVVKTDCFGIQDGSFRSAVTINGVLYYKSNHGIMRVESGSLPVCISSALGPDVWSEAIAGTDGEKYYIQMETPSGEYQLFVYDIATGFWYRESTENNKEILCFVNYKNNFCYITGKTTKMQSSVNYNFWHNMNKEQMPNREDYNSFLEYLGALAVFLRYLSEKFVTETLYREYSLMLPEKLKKTVADRLGKEPSQITESILNEYLVSSRIMEPAGTAYYWSCDFVYASGELGCNTRLPDSVREFDPETGIYERRALLPKLSIERGFQWFAETGDFGMNYSDFKRVCSVQIRMKLDEGASVSVDISYDGEKFQHLKCFDTPMKTTGRIDMQPFEKCDNFRLRFRGKGQCVIYSVTVTYEDGGDKNVGF